MPNIQFFAAKVCHSSLNQYICGMRHTILYIVVTIISVALGEREAKSQTDVDYGKMTFEEIDSLMANYSSDTDTMYLHLLSKAIPKAGDLETMLSYSEKLFSAAKRQLNAKFEMYANNYMASVRYDMDDYPQCISNVYRSLSIADSLHMGGKVLAYSYEMLGNAYAMTMNATRADEYYHQAVDAFLQIGDTANAINNLVNIGFNHAENDMYAEAKESFGKAKEYSYQIKDTAQMALSHLGLGYMDLLSFKHDEIVDPRYELLSEADKELNDAIELSKETGDDNNLMRAEMLLAEVKTKSKDFRSGTAKADSCEALLRDAYRICYETDDEMGYKMDLDFSWMRYLVAAGRAREAQVCADSLYAILSVEPELYNGQLGDMYAIYSKISEKRGHLADALNYDRLSTYWQLKKRGNTYAVAATQSIAKAQFDEQMREREIITKQNEIRLESERRQQLVISIAAIIVLILVSIFAIYMIRANIRRKEINKQLDEQNKIIRKTNDEITDSINYASLIQTAALPSEEMLDELFGEHFVYFRPRNIVSGDFYWASTVGEWNMFVASDCTGHGVPGAFVSMLGISMLNDIAARMNPEDISAAKMLDELRANLKSALHQHGGDKENRDGMDLALMILNRETRTLHYAGAFRPLIIVHEGEITKVDADRMPIGSHIWDTKDFTDHEIELSEGDMIYAFSDGIVDQFGYDESKDKEVKYSMKRLSAFLGSIAALPCREQKEKLEAEVDAWRRLGTERQTDQTDDNVLVGIRIK